MFRILGCVVVSTLLLFVELVYTGWFATIGDHPMRTLGPAFITACAMAVLQKVVDAKVRFEAPFIVFIAMIVAILFVSSWVLAAVVVAVLILGFAAVRAEYFVLPLALDTAAYPAEHVINVVLVCSGPAGLLFWFGETHRLVAGLIWTLCWSLGTLALVAIAQTHEELPGKNRRQLTWFGICE